MRVRRALGSICADERAEPRLVGRLELLGAADEVDRHGDERQAVTLRDDELRAVGERQLRPRGTWSSASCRPSESPCDRAPTAAWRPVLRDAAGASEQTPRARRVQQRAARHRSRDHLSSAHGSSSWCSVSGLVTTVLLVGGFDA